MRQRSGCVAFSTSITGSSRASPIYVTGGLEDARQGDEHPQYFRRNSASSASPIAALPNFLAAGGIDALYTARAPSTWPSANVARLFADPIGAELAYYDRTGIFPPMHVVAVKRPLADRHPGLARSLFDAFTAAQRVAQAKLSDSAALGVMLPWLLAPAFHRAKARPDYWPVGFAKNRATLETIIRYMVDDGLTKHCFRAGGFVRRRRHLLST